MAPSPLSTTQCEPAPHVAGNAASPPINPQMVFASCRLRSSTTCAGESAAAVGRGASRGGQSSTFNVRCGIVFVSRGSACASVVRANKLVRRRATVDGGSRWKKFEGNILEAPATAGLKK